MQLKSKLKLVYLGGFLLATHLALVTYVNSSLLKQFVGDNTLNFLYILGSLLSIIFLLSAPSLLRKYGSIPIFLFFIALEMLAVFGIGSTSTPIFIILLFLIHIGSGSILYLCLDINMEQETTAESTTGSERGIFLTVSNIAWILSPLVFAFLVTQNNFGKIYLLSGMALIPLFFIVSVFFNNTKKAGVIDSNIFLTIRSLWKGGDESRIIGVQFVLNFFYSWMVIYLPLLLIREIGFGWDKIGLIFTIMLLPFLLFELPAGFLADKKYGEKEILVIGFLIMFLATSLIPILSTPTFWIWATVLFATRVGASLVEISSETYFFKHVKEDDTGLISLFRMVRPLSYIMAPLFAIPIVYFFSYSTSFYFLALFTLLGLLFIPKIDTK